MNWKNTQPQSVWREFEFAYCQVKRAIDPYLSLEDMIMNWNEISKLLAERQRARKSQLSRYFEF